MTQKRWPFLESPGDFAMRLEAAYFAFDSDMLAAVRNCLIENPPMLSAAPAPASGVDAAKVRAAIRETEYKYFGDYEFSEGQHDAVETLVEVANLYLASGAAAETKGPYEARICKGMPADCCDYGVVSLSEGREVCRVWREQDARAIAASLSPAATPVSEAGGDDVLEKDWACQAWGDGSSLPGDTNIVCPDCEVVIAANLPINTAVHIAGLHNAALAKPSSPVDRAMETQTEHIARDIREGRFPERSERQPALFVAKDGSLSADWVAMILAEYGRVEDGQIANGPYLAVMIAEAVDRMLAALSPSTSAAEPVAFQQRVQPWMMACFGAEISADVVERNHRFLEEALELVQSTGCTASEAHQLVDYVYGRPVGETHQEIGGVMVTLAALCLALGQDMHAAGETELARIWTKVEKIRAKQAAKPKHSPLPEHPAPAAVESAQGVKEAYERWRKERRGMGMSCFVSRDDQERAFAKADHQFALAVEEAIRASLATGKEG